MNIPIFVLQWVIILKLEMHIGYKWAQANVKREVVGVILILNLIEQQREIFADCKFPKFWTLNWQIVE